MGIRLGALIVFIAGGVLSGRTPLEAAGATPQIAAAVNGNLVLFQVNGHGRRVLTRSGIDSDPVMSPDGRSVAFLRTPGGVVTGGQTARLRQVLMASPAGHGYRIITFSQHSALSPPAQRAIAWEPGAHPPALTWFDHWKVIWRQEGSRPVPILGAGGHGLLDEDLPIAWSPTGRVVAVPLPDRSNLPPKTLQVALSFGMKRKIVTIRFPRGILGPSAGSSHGSYPSGADLTFDRTGKQLLFGTILEGAGHQLSAVFTVRVAGGTARVLLGHVGVRGLPPFGPGLTGATDFQLSPDKQYLATDAEGGFWVAPQRSVPPVTIHVPLSLGCQIVQWRWLPDSSGIAYIRACTTPAPNTIQYRLTLAEISRQGGRERVLFAMRSRNQGAIDLAPAVRCVACG